MRNVRGGILLGMMLVAGCGGGSAGKGGTGGKGGDQPIVLPRIYPAVRAGTPSSLIANPAYATEVAASTSALTAAAGQDAIGLAVVVKERLYTMGPTEILRIVSGVDARTSTLDTRPSLHPCLTTTPVSKVYALPGGQTFEVKLQCLQEFGGPTGPGGGGGWMAFGFSEALPAWDGGVPGSDDDGGAEKSDGGKDGGKQDGEGPGETDGGVPPTTEPLPDGGALGATGGGRHFYLVEGQNGGMGSAYHFDREAGTVEAWMTVADSAAPTGSQVIMHMLTDQTRNGLELAFGGSAVGFCAAHLKATRDFLFIDGKTNAPPPPGAPNGHYCDVARSGCFAVADLTTDLGGEAAGCAPIARPSFGITVDLDASADASANVTPANIYTYFNGAPTGVPAF